MVSEIVFISDNASRHAQRQNEMPTGRREVVAFKTCHDSSKNHLQLLERRHKRRAGEASSEEDEW